MGRTLGDAAGPVAGQRALGRQFLDAGMMDTSAQPGPQRPQRQGAGRSHQQRAVRLRQLPAAFIAMYGRIVLGIDDEHFDKPLEAAQAAAKVKTDAELTPGAQELCGLLQAGSSRPDTGKPFPQDPAKQLRGAVEGRVVASWNGARAIAYRVRERISHDLGTASTCRRWSSARDQQSGNGRGFHPQRGHRAEQAVWRLSSSTTGRRCRRRHPQQRRPRSHEARVPHHPCRADRHLRSARAPLHRHVRHRVSPSSRASCGCCRPESASAPARGVEMAVDMVSGFGKGKARWKISKARGAHCVSP